MIRGSGQVAMISVLHRLPGSVGAQQLKIFLLQCFCPLFRVVSWVQKRWVSHSFDQGTPHWGDVTNPLACGGPGPSGQQGLQ